MFSLDVSSRIAQSQGRFGMRLKLIPVMLAGCCLPTSLLASPPEANAPFSVVPILMAKPQSLVNLGNTEWARTAKRYRLDPYILYAIALVESARIRDDLAHPWFWALNRNGKSVYPHSATEALQQIRQHLVTGQRNIDVGLMQVNLRWHRQRVSRLEDLLDPVINLDVGARILAEAIATAPNDLALGVGRYHAWSNPVEAYHYGRRVLRLAQRLRSGIRTRG